MFWIYFAAIIILPIYAQFKVKRTYKKYSQVRSTSGMTGAEVARLILDQNGLQNVKVVESQGFLSDHYNPLTKIVALSSHNYHEASVAGTAIAAHEVGHAIQDKEAYSYLRFRHRLAPVANITSNASWIFIMIGLIYKYEFIAWYRDCIDGCRCRVSSRYVTGRVQCIVPCDGPDCLTRHYSQRRRRACEKSIECGSDDICCGNSGSCS